MLNALVAYARGNTDKYLYGDANYYGGADYPLIAEYMNLIIDQAHQQNLNIDELAYVFATAHWETRWYDLFEKWNPDLADTEYEYFEELYGSESEFGPTYGNTEPGDGYKYRGRGFAMLTWHANYREFGLEDNPDRAAEPQLAAEIAVIGMKNGTFTGAKLSDYSLGETSYNFHGARDIINGNFEIDENGGPVRPIIARIAEGYAAIFSSYCAIPEASSGLTCR